MFSFFWLWYKESLTWLVLVLPLIFTVAWGAAFYFFTGVPVSNWKVGCRGVSRNPGGRTRTRVPWRGAHAHAQYEWGVVLHAASWAEFAKVGLHTTINFSRADASELHLFFDRAQV